MDVHLKSGRHPSTIELSKTAALECEMVSLKSPGGARSYAPRRQTTAA